MAKPQEWMVVVKNADGQTVRVRRRQTEDEAREKVARARKHGLRAEMKPEPRSHNRRDREQYINRHPRSRRRAAA